MEVKIINDAKEKAMSFEAHLEDVNVSEPYFYGSVQATGYGADENEARKNLRACLGKIIEALE